MKRYRLVFFILILSTLNTKAENSGWYIKGSIGYSKGSNQSIYLFDPMNNTSPIKSDFYTPRLGTGSSQQLGAGYMITPNLGLEGNITYLSSPKIDLYSYNTNESTVTANLQSNHLVFNPMLVFKANMKRWHPYIKVGLVLPIVNTSFLNYSVISDSSNSIINVQYRIKNELNPGLNGCVGISFTVFHNLDLYIEAEEANVRSFHQFAVLSTEAINIANGSTIPTSIIFVPNTNGANSRSNYATNFPISFGRETYSIGIKYSF